MSFVELVVRYFMLTVLLYSEDVTCVWQDVFILLDLIGTQSTRFKNLFPRTEHSYTQLQNIGKYIGSIWDYFSFLWQKHWFFDSYNSVFYAEKNSLVDGVNYKKLVC